METLTQPIDAGAWREDFFPPLNAWRILARAAAVLLLFLTWVALAITTTLGLMPVTSELANPARLSQSKITLNGP